MFQWSLFICEFWTFTGSENSVVKSYGWVSKSEGVRRKTIIRPQGHILVVVVGYLGNKVLFSEEG